MYVIVDLEWFGVGKHFRAATQIAAMRVDDSWKSVSTFGSLIRPPENAFIPWDHSSFNGGRRADFMNAPTAYRALDNFLRWLQKDDIICIWNDASADTLKKLINHILHQDISQKIVILAPYICAHAKVPNGNPQAMAIKKGIRIPPLNHWAMNDIEVARRLLEHLKFPQTILRKPIEVVLAGGMRYLYDEVNKQVHFPGSACAKDLGLQKGTSKIRKCISEGYKPCPICCKESWKKDLRESNTSIVRKTQYNYFFFRDSTVFHRGSCHLILNTKRQFLGKTHYDKCISKGMTPCKICKPIPGLVPLPLEVVPPQKKTPTVRETPIEKACKGRQLDEREKRAIARYKQATEERNALESETMTEEERLDMLILTSPEYVFWTAKGYNSFHLRSCPKLKGLSGLKGFSTYDEAIRSSHVPCRECKPSSKYDLYISVQTGTQLREDENIDTILALCDQKPFSYTYNEPVLHIVTDHAEWKITIGPVPVTIKHKPASSTEFHRQHKMFFSVADAIAYIIRHDNRLVDSVGNMLREQRQKNKEWK